MAGRFLITLAMNTFYQMMFELMPTQLRSRAVALTLSMGMLCNVLSPYVAYSVIKVFNGLIVSVNLICCVSEQTF